MNVGDTVFDIKGKEWIIYDFISYQLYDFICVTDAETQKENVLMKHDEVDVWIQKPDNVEYMFLKKRNKNLEGITSFLW
jgi:hypothetical protein